MASSKEYFQIQLDFAERVALVTGKTLGDALREYTSFYKTLKIENWDFNAADPVWKEFLAKFEQAQDKAGAAHDFYLTRREIENDNVFFGCFRYDYVEEKQTVFIHFKNNDDSVEGAVSKERKDVRMLELKEMFTDIKAKYPSAKVVSGFSWLYNIDAYKRLFPIEYTSNTAQINGWFKTKALWGQFLRKTGVVKEDLVAQFKSCIQSKTSIEDLEKCFPYRILQPKADIEFFYKFYGI